MRLEWLPLCVESRLLLERGGVGLFVADLLRLRLKSSRGCETEGGGVGCLEEGRAVER